MIRGSALIALGSALAPLLAACSSPPPPPPPDLAKGELAVAALMDVLWQWVETETPTDPVPVEDPARYTIRFETGVRAAVHADCNRGMAKYTVTGQGIRVEPRAMTRAACGPESQDYVFLRDLEKAATWEIVGGELRLKLAGGASTMKFRAAPPKP